MVRIKEVEKMLDRASFHKKIILAYSMGLLRRKEYLDLERIRKLRNHCAHSLSEASVTDEKIVKHLKSLESADLFTSNIDEKRPRDRLMITGGRISSELV